MNKIFEYLKLSLFVTAILIGIQVPGFVDQYGKNLAARAAESQQSISAFQDDANKYFNGDLHKLIKHYQQQQDPIFIDGGNSIDELVARNEFLNNALSAFKQNFYSPYLHVFVQPIAEVRQHVWQQYDYTLVLNGPSILVGILIAICILAIFEFILFGCVCGCKKVFRGKNHKQQIHSH